MTKKAKSYLTKHLDMNTVALMLGESADHNGRRRVVRRLRDIEEITGKAILFHGLSGKLWTTITAIRQAAPTLVNDDNKYLDFAKQALQDGTSALAQEQLSITDRLDDLTEKSKKTLKRQQKSEKCSKNDKTRITKRLQALEERVKLLENVINEKYPNMGENCPNIDES